TVLGKFRRLKLNDSIHGWEELSSDMPLQGLALLAHEGKVYRIGGMRPLNKPGEKADNVSVASCAVYDPAKKTWQPLPGLPQGRSSHDAAIVGNQIIVAGGWCLNGRDKPSYWHETAAILDLSQSPLTWKSIAQPFQRRALSLAALGEDLFVIGGMMP